MADGVWRRLAHGVVAEVGAALLAGCAAGSSISAFPEASSVGVYDFTATLPFTAGPMHLEGTFEVTRDTVLLVMHAAQCQAIPGGRASFTYGCEGATYKDASYIRVTFDRRLPLQHATVSAMVTTLVRQQACPASLEQPSCVSQDTAKAHREERRSVQLQVRPREWEPQGTVHTGKGAVIAEPEARVAAAASCGSDSLNRPLVR